VTSESARVSRARPFYADHAEAYDALITDPVDPWVSAVDARLIADGHSPATILDAGCGTGRHAAALLARGHEVTLVDASPALLRIAARRCPSSRAWLRDLCTLSPPDRFSAVTCRGVLNDLLIDAERESALTALTTCLQPGGVLFCDVREAVTSQARADGRRRARTVTVPSGSALTFATTSRWDEGLLRVSEEYESAATGRQEYAFVMRPWTTGELRDRLGRAGLAGVTVESGVGRRTPDRLFVTAVRP
jgi:trans-aconitate methyltransferase